MSWIGGGEVRLFIGSVDMEWIGDDDTGTPIAANEDGVEPMTEIKAVTSNRSRLGRR